jgi:hypothetical protein
LCVTWSELDHDSAIVEYQAVHRELNAEREENARLRTQIDQWG